jgi:chromosome segregation ATPase
VEALKKQVDKQKTDIKALNKENRDSKDKIETLQQELDRAKSGGGSAGGDASGDAKELENLRKKLKSFEKEKEEDELIEREIYCMTTKYRVRPSSSPPPPPPPSGSFPQRATGRRACMRRRRTCARS